MNPKVIVIDGKTYRSVEEMPPDIRQKYEEAMRSLGGTKIDQLPDALESVKSFLADNDKDGIPDLLENVNPGNAVMSSMKIIVDGKEFNGIENLPPEVRARYAAAMGKLDANKNGLPDFVEGMMKTSAPNQVVAASPSFPIDSSPRAQPIPVSPTIAPDTSNGLMLALAGLFLLLLCVAAGGAVWYFFLR